MEGSKPRNGHTHPPTVLVRSINGQVLTASSPHVSAASNGNQSKQPAAAGGILQHPAGTRTVCWFLGRIFNHILPSQWCLLCLDKPQAAPAIPLEELCGVWAV